MPKMRNAAGGEQSDREHHHERDEQQRADGDEAALSAPLAPGSRAPREALGLRERLDRHPVE
jgi:hypothetical protein